MAAYYYYYYYYYYIDCKVLKTFLYISQALDQWNWIYHCDDSLFRFYVLISGYEPCGPSEFACKHNTHRQCIAKKRVCDGFFDCTDHSDEEECATEPPACRDGYLQCNNGTCISIDIVCNTKNDCGDWSDESLCGKLAID